MTRPYTLHHVPGQHLTFKDREQIAMIYNQNLRQPAYKRLSLRELASRIGLPYSTLHREILRGRIAQPVLHQDKEYWEYSEHIAQDHIRAGAQNKGRGMRITNLIASLLAIKIKNERKSPAHARKELLAEGLPFVPALSTIYAHINHGDIGILHGETPYHPKRRTKRCVTVRRAWKKPYHLSIEDRPDLSLRDEFGHWEMDTMVSGVHGKGGLLVLIERKTRFYLIVKLRRISQLEVLRALRYLIRSGQMKKVLSITTDNGCEFLDARQIETLFSKINACLKVYYTHAYAAWEKGSVENANRHVRRWYPKGTDFRRVSVQAIRALQNFINSIPRQILQGATAHEAFLAVA
ncbi:MAG: IS30 family transposase [Kiritimatiellia bacterium]|nr:MAG: Integrase core domain protein [Verrucomicrobia bacterium ADurb.Bin018]